MLKKIKALFRSRRFYAAVATIIGVISQDVLGIHLDQVTILAIVSVVMSWIVGDSLKKTE